MTTLKRACAVAALACLFALTPRAGDMSAGYTGQPTRPALTREPDKPDPPGLRPADGNAADSAVFEAVLTLLRSMFVML